MVTFSEAHPGWLVAYCGWLGMLRGGVVTVM